MPDQTVLVVDDDIEFLRSTTEYFNDKGYQVVTANNSAEGRRMLEEGGADLAILDLRMVDGEDETDITGLILAKTVAPAIPKVVVTAHPTAEIVEAFDRLRANQGMAQLRLVGKGEGLNAVMAAVEAALTAPFAPASSRWLVDRSKIATVCLLLALALGIAATSIGDVRLLLGTVVLVIFAVFFIGIS